MVHPARLSEEDLRSQVEVERTRASGPGGQHRNRTETAIRLLHRPTGIRVGANERRSQKENLRMAWKRLRLQLALDYRRPLRDEDFLAPAAYQASPEWTSRLRKGRIQVNPDHADFPALLAEVLDLLHLYEDDLAKSAAALQTTTSQLVKFLSKEPKALAALNQRRQEAGQRPLR